MIVCTVSVELCERRGGRPGLPVPNSPYGLCGREATLNYTFRAQELCESRGGSPLNCNIELEKYTSGR